MLSQKITFIMLMFGLIFMGTNSSTVEAKGDLTSTDVTAITIEVGNAKGDYVFNCTAGCTDPNVLKVETGKAYNNIAQ